MLVTHLMLRKQIGSIVLHVRLFSIGIKLCKAVALPMKMHNSWVINQMIEI